jgi:hypothetical protein
MGINLVKQRFREQRQTAFERNIVWKFTFEEWVEWWEDHLGYNWMKKRGRGRGRYVMARKGDKGPYAPWNVECILHEQNSKDRIVNGSQVHGESSGGNILTTKKVKEIFIAKNACMRKLSTQYGVSYDTIYDIRTKQIWKRETRKLKLGSKCKCPNGTACVQGYHTYHKDKKTRQNIKLTLNQVRYIYMSKKSGPMLAQEFGISVTAIYAIWKRTAWIHVSEGLPPR